MKRQKRAVGSDLAVVVTVLNEAKTINDLLLALKKQTVRPKEIIVVDGGSDDDTWDKLQDWQKQLDSLKIYYQEGNRAVGRNSGVKQTSSNWIAFTDAGCTPQPDWLEQLVKRQRQTRASVIAGYYRGLGRTSLENAIIPYVLVMPDKIDETQFLPATRSMLIKKTIWKKVGGFDESLNSSEDYDFAIRLKQLGVKIAFARDAIVNWYPRTTLVDFAVMILDFAFWDAKAGHIRQKVKLLFARYLVFFLLISLWIETSWPGWAVILAVVILTYIIWSVWKNKKYVPAGWWWLPVLQIISDVMVIGGTMLGWVEGKRVIGMVQENDT